MRSAPWLVLGGTLAGFLGVLGLHQPATPGVLANRPAQPTAKASPGAARVAGPRPAPAWPRARSPARWCRTGMAS